MTVEVFITGVYRIFEIVDIKIYPIKGLERKRE